jgi:CheY-like chemotaxis protein
VQELNFDAIVTDLMMPGMDGMELLRHLRQEYPVGPSAIVVTAYGNIETAISTVHEYGAFWFIEKPIRPARFAFFWSGQSPSGSLFKGASASNASSAAMAFSASWWATALPCRRCSFWSSRRLQPM